MGISMDLSPAQLRDLLRETLADPQAAARRLIADNPPMEARWLGLAVVVVLSVLIGQASFLAMGAGEAGLAIGVGGSAVLHGGVLLVVVWAAYKVGQTFGGTGSFPDAVLLISWLQFMMVVLQFIQLLTLFILPPLSGLIGLLAVAAFLWVLTNFVAVLHGFESLGRVFAMIIVTFMAIVFAVAFVLAMFGVQAPGAGNA